MSKTRRRAESETSGAVVPDGTAPAEGAESVLGALEDDEEAAPFRVVDRRHGARGAEQAEADEGTAAAERPPSLVDELRGRAEEAEARLRDYIAAYRREREELEAFRRRLRETEEARARETLGGSLGRFLEVVDNLERALEHAADDDPLREGVLRTLEMMLRILQDEGVERLEPLGRAFDPEIAEAVMVRPTDADRDGTVIEVLRSGFSYAGRVLRAAQVVVGRKE